MAQRGRPKGGDSAETKVRIIDAAREEFADSGYAGASIANIAAAAGLAPSAVYHYFGSKDALYEAVFDATVSAIWTDVDAASTHMETLLKSVEAIVNQTGTLEHSHARYSDFLSLLPMEAKLQPQFQPMLERRTKHQDTTFVALAELGLRTGELDGFNLLEATEMLRSIIMGWFLESHFRGRMAPGSGDAIVTLIRLLGERR